MKSTVFVMLPAYNEARNLVPLLDKWERAAEKLRRGVELSITVINDASTDDTIDTVKAYQKTHKNVKLVNHQKNEGLSGGLNTGINEFLKQAKSKNDLLVFMDADNTHDPKYIHQMIDKLNTDKVDCVIASRYRKGAEIKGLKKHRELMSIFARGYYSALLHVPNVRDYTCGYRVYKRDIIKKIRDKYGAEPIKEKSFACMMELLYKAREVGAKFAEVGFVLRYDRKKGDSKMKVASTARKSIFTALRLQRKKILIQALLVAFSVFLTIGINFSPFNDQPPQEDASIYAYVGMSMDEGRAPYIGAYDNKGPVLYTIYAIGQLVPGSAGLYLLELASIYLAALFIYKALEKLSKNSWLSLLGAMFSFSFIGTIWQFGSLCEDFALPLIAYQIYFIVSYFKNHTESPKKSQLIMFGVTAGLIALIRLNLLAVFAAGVVAVLAELIVHKKAKQILAWLGWGILGIAIAFLPYIIYLGINGALVAGLDAAYFGAAGSFNNGTLLERLGVSMQLMGDINNTFLPIVSAVSAIISLVLIFRKQTPSSLRFICIFAVLAFLVNFYVVSLSGARQVHYMISFIPIFGLLLGILIQISSRRAFSVIIETLLLAGTIYGSIYYIDTCRRLGWIGQTNYKYGDVFSYIFNNTDPGDEIQVIGGIGCNENLMTKRLSPTRFCYLPLSPALTDEYRTNMVEKEFLPELANSTPKIILQRVNDSEINRFVVASPQYQKIVTDYVEDSESLPDYIIYRRIEE